MNKRFFRVCIVLAVVVCLFAAVTVRGFGNDGIGSDYGGGGGYDGGGSRSYGDSDGGSYLFGGDGGDGLGCGGALTVFAIILVIGLILAIRERFRKGGTPVVTNVSRTPDSQLKPIEDYIANVDPGFSAADMRSKLSNLYVQLQNSWSNMDLTPLRPYLTDELYNQSEIQLEEHRKLNRKPNVERVAVLGTNIRGWFSRDGMDHVIAEITAKMVVYYTDNATGKVVLGDMKAEKFMTYEWDVARTSGQKTSAAEELKTVNCPNCGAPVAINKSAKCPYCESVITLSEHDWVLTGIKSISQRTV